MKQIQKLREAFSDCPSTRCLLIENERYHSDSFGNEEAILRYGNLRMRFLSDRGAIYADILLSDEPSKFINMTMLMRHFGFSARKSVDPILNLREFFRMEEKRLIELGDAIAKHEIPQAVANLVVSHKPGQVVEWEEYRRHLGNELRNS